LSFRISSLLDSQAWRLLCLHRRSAAHLGSSKSPTLGSQYASFPAVVIIADRVQLRVRSCGIALDGNPSMPKPSPDVSAPMRMTVPMPVKPVKKNDLNSSVFDVAYD
jgi:hypothetical protein